MGTFRIAIMTVASRLRKFSGFFSYGVVAGGLQGVRFVSTILAAKMLGPEKFAPWLLLSSLLGYSAFMQLGVTNGLYRELPSARGAESEEKVSSLVWTAQIFLVYSTVACLCIFILLYFFHFFGLSLPTYLTFILLLFANQFYNFQHVLSHSFFHFKQLTIQMAIFASLLLPLIWIGVKCFDFAGFLLPQAILMIFSFWFLRRSISYNTDTRFNGTLLKKMIMTGIPISVIGVLFSVLTTVDRWAINLYLGKNALGYYALSVFCVNSLSILTKVVSPQFYPRMSFLYGRTGQTKAIRSLVWKQLVANSILMFIVAIIYFASVDIAVMEFIPQYLPGVKASKIIMLGIVFLACVNPFSAMMNSTERHVTYLITQSFAILVTAIGVIFAASVYSTIEAVAIATTIGYLLYMISMISVGCMILYKDSEAQSLQARNAVEIEVG